MSNITTISLSKETKDVLASLGRKGESYETIISKLVETKSNGGNQ